jgi:hypothetical protein
MKSNQVRHFRAYPRRLSRLPEEAGKYLKRAVRSGKTELAPHLGSLLGVEGSTAVPRSVALAHPACLGCRLLQRKRCSRNAAGQSQRCQGGALFPRQLPLRVDPRSRRVPVRIVSLLALGAAATEGSSDSGEAAHSVKIQLIP